MKRKENLDSSRHRNMVNKKEQAVLLAKNPH
jgi:hypothetical protein